ncbi:MAG: hypothetical protein NTV66_06195 [Methylococcales bacterium]|nr:hypothetical protein [Methylococcales bacterium]
MTFYTILNITSNQIAGAIAIEALQDMRVNNYTFHGFPSIRVSELHNDIFTVYLSCGKYNEFQVDLTLTKNKAITVAKMFEQNKRVGGDFFNKIQESLIKLEFNSTKS